MCGVRVLEFGIGLPPRLFGIKRGDTIYSINLLPLGGFVRLAGEEDPSVQGSLAGKGIATRLLVLSAGALMNFILPFLLFSIALMVPHQIYKGDILVEDISPNSPASQAGILPGDVILAANGRPLNHGGELSRAIQLNLGKTMVFTVKHSDGTIEEIKLVPRWRPPAGQGNVGVSTNTTNLVTVITHLPFWQAIPEGASDCVETFVLFKNGIISMIIGTAPAQFTGPVGIAQLTGEIASAGLSPLIEFAAFLSINLGIFNIFPLPALDGGRIAFVLLEWIRRGKRIAPKTEGLVHLVGFGLLIVFFLAITFQDISRIASGGSLIP
jgi:regulator of sigma E protease